MNEKKTCKVKMMNRVDRNMSSNSLSKEKFLFFGKVNKKVKKWRCDDAISHFHFLIANQSSYSNNNILALFSLAFFSLINKKRLKLYAKKIEKESLRNNLLFCLLFRLNATWSYDSTNFNIYCPKSTMTKYSEANLDNNNQLQIIYSEWQTIHYHNKKISHSKRRKKGGNNQIRIGKISKKL